MSQRALVLQINDCGFAWTQSTVALIETGRRQVSAEELVALALVLESSLTVLLDTGTANSVMVGDSEWRADFLRLVVDGRIAEIRETPAIDSYASSPTGRNTAEVSAHAYDQFAAQWKAQTTEIIERWGLDRSKLSVGNFNRLMTPTPAERAATDRIRRAARRGQMRLNIQPRDVAIASWRLWGRFYEEEQEKRVQEQCAPAASARSVQAMRGHVARQLDRQLRNEIVETIGTWNEPVIGKRGTSK
jgi:hypothetical protein